MSVSSRSTHRIPDRRRKEGLSGSTLFCTALLALAACDSANSPQAPQDDPVAEPVSQSAVTPGTFPGKIAFSASDGTQSDIYVMNADGSNLTRLTATPENEFSPAWSWDNSKIAFVRPRVSGQVHNDVFVIDANGTNGHWASPTPSTGDLASPAWAPDGSRLLVRSGGGIMSLDLATGALTHFKNGQADVFGLYAAFDVTGQKVVVGGSGVSVFKADGSGKIGFTMASPNNATVETPSFSPDGTTILLTEAVSPDRRRLYLFAGTTFTLVSGHGIGFGASWAPDGKQIAFGGSRGQLYRMNPDGTRRVRLTSTGGFDREPAYTH